MRAALVAAQLRHVHAGPTCPAAYACSPFELMVASTIGVAIVILLMILYLVVQYANKLCVGDLEDEDDEIFVMTSDATTKN